MRLNEKDIKSIKRIAKKCFDANARIYLFGSRVDDRKKGGDIDIYIETGVEKDLLERKLKMLGMLQKELGEQKIDIIVNNFKSSKFIYEIARNEGVRL